MRPKEFDEYYRKHTDKDKVYHKPQFYQCCVCFKPFLRTRHYRMWKGYLEYCSKECRRVMLNKERNHRAYVKRKHKNEPIDFF